MPWCGTRCRYIWLLNKRDRHRDIHCIARYRDCYCIVTVLLLYCYIPRDWPTAYYHCILLILLTLSFLYSSHWYWFFHTLYCRFYLTGYSILDYCSTALILCCPKLALTDFVSTPSSFVVVAWATTWCWFVRIPESWFGRPSVLLLWYILFYLVIPHFVLWFISFIHVIICAILL